jgi:hypothetical protein
MLKVKQDCINLMAFGHSLRGCIKTQSLTFKQNDKANAAQELALSLCSNVKL